MQSVRAKDKPLIDHVTNVLANRTFDPPTTSIVLDFSDNEYFTNKQLSLTVRMKDNDETEIVDTTGTVIDWKDGKDLSKKKIKKK
jgi:hypothetical protein